jgi:hypothetical protein
MKQRASVSNLVPLDDLHGSRQAQGAMTMPSTASAPNWVQKLVLAAQPHVPPEFVAQIVLNVDEGRIASVEIKQRFAAERQS